MNKNPFAEQVVIAIGIILMVWVGVVSGALFLAGYELNWFLYWGLSRIKNKPTQAKTTDFDDSKFL
jgi:hypothetical protein